MSISSDSYITQKHTAALQYFYYNTLKASLQEHINLILEQDTVSPGLLSLFIRRAVTLEPKEFLSFMDKINHLIKTGKIECPIVVLKHLKTINNITFNTEIVKLVDNVTTSAELVIAVNPDEIDPPPYSKAVNKQVAADLLYPHSSKPVEIDTTLCKDSAQQIAAETLVEFEKDKMNIKELLDEAATMENAASFDTSWRQEQVKITDVPALVISEIGEDDDLDIDEYVNDIDSDSLSEEGRAKKRLIKYQEKIKEAIIEKELSWETAIDEGLIIEATYAYISFYELKNDDKMEQSKAYKIDDSELQAKIEKIRKTEADIQHFLKNDTQDVLEAYQKSKESLSSHYSNLKTSIEQLASEFSKKAALVPPLARMIGVKERNLRKQFEAGKAAQNITYNAYFDLNSFKADLAEIQKTLNTAKLLSTDLRIRKEKLLETLKKQAKDKGIDLTDEIILTFPEIQELLAQDQEINDKISEFTEYQAILLDEEKVIEEKVIASLKQHQELLKSVITDFENLNKEYNILALSCDMLAHKIAELTKNKELTENAKKLSEQIKVGPPFNLDLFKNDLEQISRIQKSMTEKIIKIQAQRETFIQELKVMGLNTDDNNFQKLPIFDELDKHYNELIKQAQQLEAYHETAKNFITKIEKDAAWKNQINELISYPLENIIESNIIDPGTKALLIERATLLSPKEFRSYLDILWSDFKDKGELALALMQDLKKINDLTWNNLFQDSTTMFDSNNRHLITDRPILQPVLDLYKIDQNVCQSFIKHRILDKIGQLRSSLDPKELATQIAARQKHEETLVPNVEWRKKPVSEITEDNEESEPIELCSDTYKQESTHHWQVTIANSVVKPYGSYVEWNSENPEESLEIWYEDPNEQFDSLEEMLQIKSKREKAYNKIIKGINPHWAGGHLSLFSLPFLFQQETPAPLNLSKNSTIENNSSLDTEKSKIKKFETHERVQQLYTLLENLINKNKEETSKTLSEISALQLAQAQFDRDTARMLMSEPNISEERRKEISGKISKLALYQIDTNVLKAGIEKMDLCAENYEKSVDSFKQEIHQLRNKLMELSAEFGLSYTEMVKLPGLKELTVQTEDILSNRNIARNKYQTAKNFLSNVEAAKLEAADFSKKYEPASIEIQTFQQQLIKKLEENKRISDTIKLELNDLVKKQREEFSLLVNIPARELTKVQIENMAKRYKEISELQAKFAKIKDNSKHEFNKYQENILRILKTECQDLLEGQSVEDYKEALDISTPYLPSLKDFDLHIKTFYDKGIDTDPLQSDVQKFISEASKNIERNIALNGLEDRLKKEHENYFQIIIKTKNKIQDINLKMDGIFKELSEKGFEFTKLLNEMSEAEMITVENKDRIKNECDRVLKQLKVLKECIKEQEKLEQDLNSSNLPKKYLYRVIEITEDAGFSSDKVRFPNHNTLIEQSKEVKLDQTRVANYKSLSKRYNDFVAEWLKINKAKPKSPQQDKPQTQPQLQTLLQTDELQHIEILEIQSFRKQLFDLSNNIVKSLKEEHKRVVDLGIDKQEKNKAYVEGIKKGIALFSPYSESDNIPKQGVELVKQFSQLNRQLTQYHQDMFHIPLYRASPLKRLWDWFKRTCGRLETNLSSITTKHKTAISASISDNKFIPFKEKFSADSKTPMLEKDQKLQMDTPDSPKPST